MAEGVRPEDYCDEPVEDEFGEIIKCRSGRRSKLFIFVCVCVRPGVCALLCIDLRTRERPYACVCNIKDPSAHSCENTPPRMLNITDSASGIIPNFSIRLMRVTAARYRRMKQLKTPKYELCDAFSHLTFSF